MSDQLSETELVPVAAKLLSALVSEQPRASAFLTKCWSGCTTVNDEKTREAIRRFAELPTLFNLFRADAYLVRRFVSLVSASIEEAKAQPDHPLRLEFDRFAHEFIEKLGSSPNMPPKRRLSSANFWLGPKSEALPKTCG